MRKSPIGSGLWQQLARGRRTTSALLTLEIEG
jgi:hypothetical protein